MSAVVIESEERDRNMRTVHAFSGSCTRRTLMRGRLYGIRMPISLCPTHRTVFRELSVGRSRLSLVSAISSLTSGRTTSIHEHGAHALSMCRFRYFVVPNYSRQVDLEDAA
jgi:hypothetical protein